MLHFRGSENKEVCAFGHVGEVVPCNKAVRERLIEVRISITDLERIAVVNHRIELLRAWQIWIRAVKHEETAFVFVRFPEKSKRHHVPVGTR